jgi:hypothetical protein
MDNNVNRMLDVHEFCPCGRFSASLLTSLAAILDEQKMAEYLTI